jgi:hypothetical protein
MLRNMLMQATAETPRTEAPPPEPAAAVHTEAARAQIAQLATLDAIKYERARRGRQGTRHPSQCS